MGNPAHPWTHHGLVGMGGATCLLAAGRAVRHPAHPISGCFGVLGLFWGAGPGARGRAGQDGPAAAGFDAGWDSEPWLVQDPALQPSHPREISLNSYPTWQVAVRQRVPALARMVTHPLDLAVGDLCLCGSTNPSKRISLTAAEEASSTGPGQCQQPAPQLCDPSRRTSGSEPPAFPRSGCRIRPPPSHHRTARQGAAAAGEGHPPAPSAANPASKENTSQQRLRRRALLTHGACAAQPARLDPKMKPAPTPRRGSPPQENAHRQCRK